MQLDRIPSIPIRNWRDAERAFDSFSRDSSQWVFRGLTDAQYDLETTLDRDVGVLWGASGPLSSKDPGVRRAELRRVLQTGPAKQAMWKVERRLLREFARQYHHFADNSSTPEDALEWLSIMRHYGAPCRLLDFTYSWFVALFFALDGARGAASVWAIDMDWLDREVRSARRRILSPKARRLYEEDAQLRKDATSEAILWANPAKRGVVALNPRRLNPRLVIQQGVFLCPLDVSAPFIDNLGALLTPSGVRDRLKRYVISEDADTRRDLLRRLQRMNMNRATLFPGLDGFATSLRTYLANAHLFERSSVFHSGRWK
jgi:hypothetical protein